jgi:hypothetical protein
VHSEKLISVGPKTKAMLHRIIKVDSQIFVTNHFTRSNYLVKMPSKNTPKPIGTIKSYLQ